MTFNEVKVTDAASSVAVVDLKLQFLILTSAFDDKPLKEEVENASILTPSKVTSVTSGPNVNPGIRSDPTKVKSMTFKPSKSKE